MTIRAKLTEHGLALPPATPTQFAYAPLTVHGGVAYLAGQIPKTRADAIRAPGRVGAEVTVAEAQQDAALCVLHGLAWLETELGSVDAVLRPLRLTVYVAADPECARISEVADGASRLLVLLFGESAGQPPRSVVGVSRLPRDAPVMVEAIYAVAGDT